MFLFQLLKLVAKDSKFVPIPRMVSATTPPEGIRQRSDYHSYDDPLIVLTYPGKGPSKDGELVWPMLSAVL